MNKIICLWSCPRNVSTALMYSFGQRQDTFIFDEPLYAHYLKISGAQHPGRDEILNSQENDGDKVVREIILKKSNRILFHKLMSHFLIKIDTDFLSLVNNIILIRNPQEIIHSYNKVIPNPKINDIGVKQQYDLYLELVKRGQEPIILDSKYLLKDPHSILVNICELLEIPFDINMLKWKKGARAEDGVWAKYWYKNIHNSTGFLAKSQKKIKLSYKNTKLLESCLPYYNYLTTKSIKI